MVGGIGGLRVGFSSGGRVVPMDRMCGIVGFGLCGLPNGRRGDGVEGDIVVWLLGVGVGVGSGVVIVSSNGPLEGNDSVGGP